MSRGKRGLISSRGGREDREPIKKKSISVLSSPKKKRERGKGEIAEVVPTIAAEKGVLSSITRGEETTSVKCRLISHE